MRMAIKGLGTFFFFHLLLQQVVHYEDFNSESYSKKPEAEGGPKSDHSLCKIASCIVLFIKVPNNRKKQMRKIIIPNLNYSE